MKKIENIPITELAQRIEHFLHAASAEPAEFKEDPVICKIFNLAGKRVVFESATVRRFTIFNGVKFSIRYSIREDDAFVKLVMFYTGESGTLQPLLAVTYVLVRVDAEKIESYRSITLGEEGAKPPASFESAYILQEYGRFMGMFADTAKRAFEETK